MTQHEINNLVQLLMSGDEQNILMAKAVCEERKRMDIILKTDYLLKNTPEWIPFLENVYGFVKRKDFETISGGNKYPNQELVIVINQNGGRKECEYHKKHNSFALSE